MSLSIPGVVCFDYGEVISHAPSEHDTAALLTIAGIPSAEHDRFWEVYWAHRPPLDQGVITPDEYWQQLAGEFDRDWDLAERQRLWAVDFRSWISSDRAVIRLIERLHDGGTRLALLSNAGRDFGDAFRNAPSSQLFERVFVSAELGLLKPDPAIYLRVCEELGIEPAELVFIDNKAENVDAVVALGGRGHRYIAADALRGYLERLAG